ncbi:hypothetical protein [Streptomyces albospinus]|uniref:hypothetical protein n=1 Tax=Streptomyces albospinus TaxID=285515 RepID=UPI0016715DCF|nr:hypothetical protein [Streptomyces albospinus]
MEPGAVRPGEDAVENPHRGGGGAGDAPQGEGDLAVVVELRQRAEGARVAERGARRRPQRGGFRAQFTGCVDRLARAVAAGGQLRGQCGAEEAGVPGDGVQCADDPARLAAVYDSGDGVHPGGAGVRALADALDPALFA